MARTKLPIGIQDFESIISDGYTYIDKTKLIFQMITTGKPYFLARPRRFGKSLLVSTLESLFLGRRDLFRGLWIDQSDWNWDVHPIIRLDMSTINNRSPEMFQADLIRSLNDIAKKNEITLSGVSPANYLENLIDQLSVKQKVVVLVDEYDKAIINNIEHIEVATKNREILQDFYSILKAKDKFIKFVFLTGITKFSKVSVFSGLNNLKDITMSNDYSTLLGYTRNELEQYFANDIKEVAKQHGLTLSQCYDRIKDWYNGYKFAEHGEFVYNPFSTLNLIEFKTFSSYWFETATPTFLINILKNRQFDLSNFDEIEVADKNFNSFDVEDIHTLPLLYQTGYLTIKSILPETDSWILGFPNREVRQAFSASLLKAFSSSESEYNKFLVHIAKNLHTKPWDQSKFFEIISNLFALIPYDLYIKHEKYFHSLFYLAIKLGGFKIDAEVHTQQGRTDAALEMKDKVIIFEFKLDESPGVALEQIKRKKYYEKYQEKHLPIYLVGINFNSKLRTIDGWQVECMI